MATQPKPYLTPEEYLAFEREENNQWLLSETDSVEDVITLPSIGCRLAVADLYEKVEFESNAGNHP